ncbi:MAG TPA: biotin carboxylase N-terminal domain-containing protein [Vicinamibacterales bacterium]|nr:biotin carboxylase N-terminal domain-containing protein [Vicinamibacterales bacterium]
MIRRLLIANRAEIAVRIARACREMGVQSVAVYSDADQGAAHAVAADRAVRIGAAPALDSYLNAATLIEAARTEGADAIHPGYGFLSENAGFARACLDAGLVFVGPPPEAIARMGSKIEARRIVQAAGVPIVPGETPGDQSDTGIIRAIDALGLPALIKASAGGGGRGMRDVRDMGSAAAAVQSARREAEAAFRDGTLYVERLIDRPHHVEVQVVLDAHGAAVHLFERDCSVQRRHQKVIEESPSPHVTPSLRQRMTDAAVRAARAAGYVNAGTFEFLVDLAAGGTADPPFYFLEMNTRLQVEHPVTEQVAGVDLVHAQLLVASGLPLPWDQGALTQRGHAIEARVYAEDPTQGFIPQAGRLLLYREPVRPGIRIDSGFREGDTIPVHYDPLIAKVIATAESRALAIRRLATALREFPILGIRTNVPFLIRVLESSAFENGRIHTRFLDEEGASLTSAASDAPPDFLRAVIDVERSAPVRRNPGAIDGGWDPWVRARDWSVR